MIALNKAGHGMHTCPGPFHDYTVSKKVKSLARELGWTNPVVPQSMYIFKQPWITMLCVTFFPKEATKSVPVRNLSGNSWKSSRYTAIE